MSHAPNILQTEWQARLQSEVCKMFGIGRMPVIHKLPKEIYEWHDEF